jgi:hypothetical protein
MAFGANEVESPQRKMQLLALRKTGAGTPVLSGLCAKFCSVVDNGPGDYTIVVNTQQPFAQNAHAVAMPHAPGIIHLDLAASDKLQITVNCFAVDGTTAAELDFELIVVGSLATDLIG